MLPVNITLDGDVVPKVSTAVLFHPAGFVCMYGTGCSRYFCLVFKFVTSVPKGEAENQIMMVSH